MAPHPLNPPRPEGRSDDAAPTCFCDILPCPICVDTGKGAPLMDMRLMLLNSIQWRLANQCRFDYFFARSIKRNALISTFIDKRSPHLLISVSKLFKSLIIPFNVSTSTSRTTLSDASMSIRFCRIELLYVHKHAKVNKYLQVYLTATLSFELQNRHCETGDLIAS